LAATAAALFGIGTYLLLQRKLSRIIIGLGLLTHGANVLLITAGRRGDPPLIRNEATATFADPLPQALALTAIVITFALTTYLLALGYRSWVLTGDDTVQDDIEDRRIAALSRPEGSMGEDAADDTGADGDDDPGSAAASDEADDPEPADLEDGDAVPAGLPAGRDETSGEAGPGRDERPGPS